MTEQQQYRVIADRDKGDDPQWPDVVPGDRYTAIARDIDIRSDDDLIVRIERPVPTTDEPSAAGQVREPLDTEELRCRAAELEEAGWSDIVDAQNAAVPVFYAAADEIDALRAKHPSLPTREQIAEAWDRAREDRSIPRERDGGMRPVDAFEAGFRYAHALIQKEADR